MMNWDVLCHNLILLLCLQVFIAISLSLGDGLYNLIKITAISIKEMCKIIISQKDLPILEEVLGKSGSPYGYLTFLIYIVLAFSFYLYYIFPFCLFKLFVA